MIVCDSCQRLNVPAFQTHVSVGLHKDANRTGYQPLLSVSASCRAANVLQVDLCQQCGEMLAAKVREFLIPMIQKRESTSAKD